MVTETLFYMGRNDANVSRVSWKLWKIVRHGRKVTALWGPAEVVQRKVVFKYKAQKKSWWFRSERLAKQFVLDRVAQK